MYIKDITIEKPESAPGTVKLGSRVGYGVRKLNINRLELTPTFNSKAGGPRLILYGLTTPSMQEQNPINLYIPLLEGGEEEGPVFNIYGIEKCGALYGMNAYPLDAAYTVGVDMGIDFAAGAVNISSVGSRLFHIGVPVSGEVRLSEELEGRLEIISQLPENWDSYNANRINSQAIEKVKSLLISVSMRYGLRKLEDVFIAPCSDGGLQLEWKFDSQKELIVKISSSGKNVTFLSIEPSQNEPSIEREGTIERMEDWNTLFGQIAS